MHVRIMPLHFQIIMSKPAGGPKPKDNPNWDEDWAREFQWDEDWAREAITESSFNLLPGLD